MVSDVGVAVLTLAEAPPIVTALFAGAALKPVPVSVAVCPSTRVAGETDVRVTVPEGVTAVATKVTGDPVAPSTRAATDWLPSPAPSVHDTEDRPSGAVVDVVWERVPPPVVTAHITLTPGSGAPC
jgi:hypothetical protein